MNRLLLLAASLIGFSMLFAAGCARQTDPYSTPPTITYGQDVCTRSGMIISDPTYAAAYRTPDGTVRPFDDIGEMVMYFREHHEDVASLWVHDEHSGEWIRADGASYVLSAYISTPMGFGLAARSTVQDARAEAARVAGEELSFGELVSYPYLLEGGAESHMHMDPMQEEAQP